MSPPITCQPFKSFYLALSIRAQFCEYYIIHRQELYPSKVAYWNSSWDGEQDLENDWSDHLPFLTGSRLMATDHHAHCPRKTAPTLKKFSGRSPNYPRQPNLIRNSASKPKNPSSSSSAKARLHCHARPHHFSLSFPRSSEKDLRPARILALGCSVWDPCLPRLAPGLPSNPPPTYLLAYL